MKAEQSASRGALTRPPPSRHPLRLADLGGRHYRGDEVAVINRILSRRGVGCRGTLLSSLAVSLDRLRVVLRQAVAVTVHEAQVVLHAGTTALRKALTRLKSWSATLLSSLAVSLDRGVCLASLEISAFALGGPKNHRPAHWRDLAANWLEIQINHHIGPLNPHTAVRNQPLKHCLASPLRHPQAGGGGLRSRLYCLQSRDDGEDTA